MAITLKHLEAFVMVSDLSSFRHAAERLHTTQPNISTRITALETLLGHQLLERDAGSVRLTHKGRELLVHARMVLAQRDNLIDAASANTLLDGTLRLGVTELIIQTWLSDFLAAIKRDMPNITVELTAGMSQNLSSILFDKTIDLSFQNGPFDRTTSGQIALGEYLMVWVCATKQSSTRPEDMTKHPILTLNRTTELYAEISTHFEALSSSKTHLVPNSNLVACHHMVRHNMGIAALPLTLVRDDLASGTLHRIPYTWVPAPLRFMARYEIERAPLYVTKAAALAAQVASIYNKN